MYALYSLRINTLYANIFSPKYSAKWNSGLFFGKTKGGLVSKRWLFLICSTIFGCNPWWSS